MKFNNTSKFNNATNDDCGSCKNCKDKRCFGGPGIRKQACCNKNGPLYALNILSKVAGVILEIDGYNRSYPDNVLSGMILLTNIILIDQKILTKF